MPGSIARRLDAPLRKRGWKLRSGPRIGERGKYGKLLDQFKMRVSMSGKGNSYDNAPMESFWGTLKTELIFHRQYATRQEAIRDITEYIELF
jgi:transposase InsO family protein